MLNSSKNYALLKQRAHTGAGKLDQDHKGNTKNIKDTMNVIKIKGSPTLEQNLEMIKKDMKLSDVLNLFFTKRLSTEALTVKD